MVVTKEELKYSCQICKVKLEEEKIDDHKKSVPHRMNWLKYWYQNNRLLLAKDKNGMEVQPLEPAKYIPKTGSFIVTLPPDGEEKVVVTVRNTGREAAVLRMVQVLCQCPLVSLTDEHGVTSNTKFVRITPGLEYNVEVMVRGGGQQLRVEEVPIVFQFQPDNASELFFIIRTLEVVVVDQVAREAGASSRFTQGSQVPRMYRTTALPGVPLPRNKKNAVKISMKLEKYMPSKSLKDIARKNFSEKKMLPKQVKETTKLRSLMNSGLCQGNHKDWYQTMLWLEELQMQVDIGQYSMSGVPLKKAPRSFPFFYCMELEVPGLAEKRPSVLVGDNVYVKEVGDSQQVVAGVVHHVTDKFLYLAFSCSFLHNTKVDVEFEFNRHPLQVCHRALDLSSDLSHITFPQQRLPSPVPEDLKLVLYDRKIENNAEQMEAVQHILRRSSVPSPYIIFGPPGTGKTITLVEAIKQVSKLYPESRILACAPSNTAADLITERLLRHMVTREVFRFSARSRNRKDISESLVKVSNIGDDGQWYRPSKEQLLGYRVIISTMINASWLVSVGVPVGHLTHIFLDECGQSTEPEALAPLAGLANKETQLVLAGDHHQLGPVIRNNQILSDNKFFPKAGLDKSLLERLMENFIYQPKDKSYNSSLVTKLINNYRSHKDIIYPSNKMFYNSELKACGEQQLLESLCRWEHLPKKNFPLIFHNVQGKDEREANSPSFFNALEVSQVVSYVKKLLATRSPKISHKDIGIIAPYRRQIMKIKKQLGKVPGADEIMVGSPEEFQGGERLVIIISTVRASVDHLTHDFFFKLGFLSNPKRFNVAVTRAKALLIVVGCANILYHDTQWGTLLKFIQEGGGYCGTAPSLPEERIQLQDLLMKFNNLSLNPLAEEEGPSSREQAHAPEWKLEM